MENKIVKLCIVIVFCCIAWIAYVLNARAGEYFSGNAEYNQQQYEWDRYTSYQKRLQQRNLQIQREKKRVNSWNRNRQVEIKPSNPTTYYYAPPRSVKPIKKYRRIGRAN